MKLNGEELTKYDVLKRVGEMSQIADARPGVLTDGKADGVKVIDVKTGSGLTFSVVPSRGLDIAWAEYKGNPISHISKTGMVAPEFFEKDGLNFFRGFYCGLLTTCGMTYFGPPCTDQGEELGLHGRVSNIPAQSVSVKKYWDENDDYIIKITGDVVESCVFREYLILHREITVKAGESKISIHDTVENAGFNKQPLMMLYHCNFGYPVVSEDTVLLEPEGVQVKARDSEGDVSKYNRFQVPTHDYKEQVFYHDIPKYKDDYSYASLYNRKINLGAYVKFDRNQFTHFGEWKMMGEGEYVVGLEPATWYAAGRDIARQKGELKFIEPCSEEHFDLEIGILTEEAEPQ